MGSEYSFENRIIKITDSEFHNLSNFIFDKIGIVLPESKKIMLESRLSKRIRELGLSSFGEYYELIADSRADHYEYNKLVCMITTNKTDFFRESYHFDYMVENVLPKLIDNGNVNNGKEFKVWSAGCSTGEEPYTIAMVIGPMATSHIDLESLYGTFGIHGLIGKRLNIIEEVHGNYYQSNNARLGVDF